MTTRQPGTGAALLERWGLALLLLATVAVYAGALRAGFVWDDHTLVEQNTLSGWQGLLRSFQVDLWQAGGVPDGPPYYRPLVLVSLLVDRLLWGLSPVGHHVQNLLWHLAACWALHRLLRQLLPWPGALAGAALFALHPLQSEVLAFTVARNDAMAAALGLAALLQLLPRRVGGGRLLLAGLLFALALLSKESIALLPAVLLVLDLARWSRPGSLGRYAALVVVFVGWLGLRQVVGVRAGHLPNQASLLLLGQQLPDLVALYGRLLLAPWPLSTGRHLVYLSTSWPLLLLGWAVWSALAALALRLGGRLAWAGLAVCLLACAPGVLATAGTTIIAERYAYLPLAGLALTGGAILSAGGRRTWPALLLMLPWLVLIPQRMGDWVDDNTLFAADASRTPNGWSLHRAGAVYLRQGDAKGALPWFVAALAFEPTYPSLCGQTAAAAAHCGSLSQAVQALAAFQRAGCQIGPEEAAWQASIYAAAGDWPALARVLPMTQPEVLPEVWLPAVALLAVQAGDEQALGRALVLAAELGVGPAVQAGLAGLAGRHGLGVPAL